MCAWTRFLVLGGLVGLSVATVTGNDATGWAAGLAAALALLVAARAFPARFGATSCPLPASSAEATESAESAEATEFVEPALTGDADLADADVTATATDGAR